MVWVEAQEQKVWRSSKQTGNSFNPTDRGLYFVMPAALFCGRAQVPEDGSGLQVPVLDT